MTSEPTVEELERVDSHSIAPVEKGRRRRGRPRPKHEPATPEDVHLAAEVEERVQRAGMFLAFRYLTWMVFLFFFAVTVSLIGMATLFFTGAWEVLQRSQ